MTMIDKFIAFAKSLPADRLGPVEEALGTIMATWDEDTGFTSDELATLDQRLAETTPAYSSENDITDLLGKPFA